MPNRQPPHHDKYLRQADDMVRDVARGLRCLHLSLANDIELYNHAVSGSHAVPSVQTQVENLFALLGSASAYLEGHRLKLVDNRFPVGPEPEGLVGSEEIKQLENIKKMSSKFEARQQPKFPRRWNPHFNSHYQHGKSKGKSKGKGKAGKGGRGRGFSFNKPDGGKE